MYINLGYQNLAEFVFKYIFPTMFISILFSGIFIIEPAIPNFLSIFVLIIGFGFMILYPVLSFFHRTVEIHEYLHFFITYSSALANLQVTKGQIFKKVSEFRRFGYISDVSAKIVYFLKQWNVTFPETVRKVSKLVPSKIFKDFLDRLATVSDFGEDIEIFLDEEQEAVMTDLENQYEQTFENIKTVQEVFVSLIITVAFMMAISLLMPIISPDVTFSLILQIGLIVVFILDGIVVLVVWILIPRDRMFHNLDIEDDLRSQVNTMFLVTTPFTLFILLFIGFTMVDRIPFLLTIGLGISPLMVPALYALEAENKVHERDKSYPTFIRTMGEALETKGGAVLSTVEGLRTHFFGSLDDMFQNLYKRLKIGSDKYMSWLYFSGETGSNLIYQFTQIFVESIYLGANAEKVGSTISENFTKILNLRKIKFQLGSQMRGTFYGALVGFTATTYISANITEKLSFMFTQPMENLGGMGEFQGVIDSIVPAIPEVDMFVVNTLIGIMVIIHALASSITIKIIEGGSKFAILFDFIVLVWIGAFLSTTIPVVMDVLLPSFGG